MGWKGIDGYPGYEVSSGGQVRSFWGRGRCGGLGYAPRLLKPSIGTHGRRVVVLRRSDGKHVQKLVYRLVLEAFRGNAPPFMEACHNDGNCLNDCLSNLRWDTPANNQRDRKIHNTHNVGEHHPNSKLTWDKVGAIRLSLECGTPQRTVASIFHIDPSQVSLISRQKAWVAL